MAVVKDIFRILKNGIWDEHHFRTSADQVVYTKPDGTASNVQKELAAQNSTLKVKHQQVETIYFIAVIKFKKYGHLVNAYINTELRHSLPADTDTFITTIPEEYRPVDYDYNAPLIMTGRHVGIITFLSNGNIMAHPTEFLDPGWLNFNITYIV